ncbi:MAG: hypothetical protein U9O94_06370 [Nanoarchaeota archaeon]|nr:hypothetical protein [Nanoarchaeota archaeon]
MSKKNNNLFIKFVILIFIYAFINGYSCERLQENTKTIWDKMLNMAEYIGKVKKAMM